MSWLRPALQGCTHPGSRGMSRAGVLTQGQALLGWWVPCCDGVGRTGAATALRSVRDQPECAKAELEMGSGLSCWGPPTEERLQPPCGSSGLGLSWHGEGKLKANFPGTQAFQWLPLAPALPPCTEVSLPGGCGMLRLGFPADLLLISKLSG